MATTTTTAGATTWAVTYLTTAGFPVNKTNLGVLHYWAQSEGWPNSLSPVNNPLANGTAVTGSTHDPNVSATIPVQNYATVTMGAQAFAQAMKAPTYSKIAKAFAATSTNGTSPKSTGITWGGAAQLFTAINSSRWCKGCQTGKYPTALASALAARQQGASAAGGSWPTSTILKGTPNPTATKKTTGCAINWGGIGGVGSFCLLSKSQLRALKGGLLIAAGGGVAIVGVLLLAAYGLGNSKAAAKLASSATKGQRIIQTPRRIATQRSRSRTQRAQAGAAEAQATTARNVAEADRAASESYTPEVAARARDETATEGKERSLSYSGRHGNAPRTIHQTGARHQRERERRPRASR